MYREQFYIVLKHLLGINFQVHRTLIEFCEKTKKLLGVYAKSIVHIIWNLMVGNISYMKDLFLFTN